MASMTASRISTILAKDSHLSHGVDLRREKGSKRLTAFLKAYRDTMPRTMLRYAIEKYPESQRKQFLRKARRA